MTEKRVRTGHEWRSAGGARAQRCRKCLLIRIPPDEGAGWRYWAPGEPEPGPIITGLAPGCRPIRTD